MAIGAGVSAACERSGPASYTRPMDDVVTDSPTVADTDGDPANGTPVELIEDELLVEEISIDGMCGVY